MVVCLMPPPPGNTLRNFIFSMMVVCLMAHPPMSTMEHYPLDDDGSIRLMAPTISRHDSYFAVVKQLKLVSTSTTNISVFPIIYIHLYLKKLIVSIKSLNTENINDTKFA